MMNKLRSLIVSLALLAAPVLAQVPVGDFFRDAEVSSVSLSPTGEYMTVSVPQEDRTILAAFRVADMKLVAKWDYGEKQHIEGVRWVNDRRFLMYATYKVGRFDSRVGTPDLYASDVDGKNRTDIPNGGTYQIIDTLEDDDKYVLVARSVDQAFLSKLNVYDGRVITVASAPLRFGTFLHDNAGQLKYAVGSNEEGDTIILERQGEGWKTISTTATGGSLRVPVGFAPDDRSVIFQVSDKGEPGRLVQFDPASGQETLLSDNPRVSINDFLLSADERHLLAVEYMDGVPGYQFVDKQHEESKVYAGLVNAFPDHVVSFPGISRDGRYILLFAHSDVDPGNYYLFDRQTGQAKFLLSVMSWIKPEQMAPMEPISFKARDGLEIHGYLTRPLGSEGKRLPLILHPHGGPHGPRDEWGFNPEVQFLANRGYAVLQVNFRGSGGYGRAFEEKGYRAWGTTMIDDMTDAVDWAVARGMADPKRLCVYGASYGGYASLQSVVREPTKYRCAIGYVGLYDMSLWMRDSDVSEEEFGRNYQRRVFPESQAGRDEQSPARNVDRIQVPLMLVHGAKDERVPISQYNELMSSLKAAGKAPEVTIVEAKEGHGFYDYDNQVELYTAMEAFLAKHLGSTRSDAP